MTTTTTPRTDIHRPIDMDPTAYEYEFAFDNGPGGLVGIMSSESGREMWASLMADLARSPMGESRGTHQCHHCGARIRYVALMRYIPTGEIIAIGETCLDNRFALASKADFDRLRKAAALDRQQQRIKTAALEFIESTDGDVNIALRRETDLAQEFGLEGFGLDVVTDIRKKLFMYGSLSEKQVAFVGRLISEAAARKVAVATRKPEETVAHPVGRVTFDGVVIKRTWKDSDYGGGFKIIVKVTEGQNANGEDRIWLVWVSEPSSIETKFGDTVRMTATLKQSDREFWAWGSRPSGATITGHKDDQLPDALAD